MPLLLITDGVGFRILLQLQSEPAIQEGQHAVQALPAQTAPGARYCRFADSTDVVGSAPDQEMSDVGP